MGIERERSEMDGKRNRGRERKVGNGEKER